MRSIVLASGALTSGLAQQVPTSIAEIHVGARYVKSQKSSKLVDEFRTPQAAATIDFSSRQRKAKGMLEQLKMLAMTLWTINPAATFDAPGLDSGSTCRMLLVRHGETNFNAEGRFQGRLESELTAKGHAQASLLGEWLAASESDTIDRVFVSPRVRTRQTLANIEAKHDSLPSAEVRPDLREIELTMWEGQLRSDLLNSQDAERWARWKLHPASFVFEEDDHAPLGDLKRRAGEEWAYLVAAAPPGSTSLVVAHGAFNRVFVQAALGLLVDDLGFLDEHFGFDNCETVELLWEPGAAHAFAWRRLYPSESPWMTRKEEVERRSRAESA